MTTNTDKNELDKITARFFAAFTTGDTAVCLTPLRALFVNGAIITKTCGPEFATCDIDTFIEPREQLLNSGDLVDFSEYEIVETTQIFGDIAQRWCSYHKQGVLHGRYFAAQGMKTIQFVRTNDGWRISAVAWDDERDDLKIQQLEHRS